MAKYKYTALKDNKTIVQGELDAIDVRDAREQIRVLGFVPTKVYTEESPKVSSEVHVPVEKKRVKFLSLTQKILFTSQMQTMLSAGIPVIEALNSIEMNAHDKKLKTLCCNLRLSIMNEGKTFAQALCEMAGEAFGNVYTALVKTGEDSGDLDITLDRMLTLLRKQQNIKDHIIKASIYPGFLLMGMFGLLILFAKFVFPAFACVMAFNGAELPCFAKSIIGTINFVNQFWWLLLMFFGAICGFFVHIFKTPSIKSIIDDFVLKIPVLSDFIKYINLSNFMTVLHISYEAGLPLVSGLELANRTVGNYSIKSKIHNSINLARSGKTLTESFQRTNALPDEFLSIVSSGEKSGTLGKMFKDIADMIDKKVDLALEALLRLLEPTMIVILGGAVLLIVVAFFQAYTGMLGSLF